MGNILSSYCPFCMPFPPENDKHIDAELEKLKHRMDVLETGMGDMGGELQTLCNNQVNK